MNIADCVNIWTKHDMPHEMITKEVMITVVIEYSYQINIDSYCLLKMTVGKHKSNRNSIFPVILSISIIYVHGKQ